MLYLAYFGLLVSAGLVVLTNAGFTIKSPVKATPITIGRIETETDAFNAAKNGWIRMKSNRACGFYDIIEPEKIMPEPDWPDMSFADMLQTAFNDDHLVERDDHPALRRLKGGM